MLSECGSPSHTVATKFAPDNKQDHATPLRVTSCSTVAQPVPPSLSESYHARADRSGVPHMTLHCRARGRRSIEEKAES